jgi:hypothetical protein
MVSRVVELPSLFRRDGNEEPNMAYVATGNPELILRIAKSVGAKRDYRAKRAASDLRFR